MPSAAHIQGLVMSCAAHHVEWIDGRHGSSQRPLPLLDEAPVPDILNRLPYLHEQRPRGSTAMIDAAGARARLHGARPGGWLISPYTGWKWAKWPSGQVGMSAGFHPTESARGTIFSNDVGDRTNLSSFDFRFWRNRRHPQTCADFRE